MTEQRRSEEEALLARYRSGDDEALSELCGRYEALVRDRIRRRLPQSLRRRVSVSDVLQEARLAAFQGREGFESQGEGSFGRWFLGIADHKALEAVRRYRGVAKRDAGREVTRERRPETAQLRGRMASPSQMAVASELAHLVREAMADLPEDYREVLRLTRDEHLTLQEAADRMGRSYQATKKLCARALSRFAEELRKRRGETIG